MGPPLIGVGPDACEDGLLGPQKGLSTLHACQRRTPAPGPGELVPGPGELVPGPGELVPGPGELAVSHMRVYGNSSPILCGPRIPGGKDEAPSSAGAHSCRAPAPGRRGCRFTGTELPVACVPMWSGPGSVAAAKCGACGRGHGGLAQSLRFLSSLMGECAELAPTRCASCVGIHTPWSTPPLTHLPALVGSRSSRKALGVGEPGFRVRGQSRATREWCLCQI